MKAATGIACHTFGELLQGQVDGVPFLVSLPIESYVKATFYPDAGGELMTSPHKLKVRRVIRRFLHDYQLPFQGTLLVEQSLPEGKGFATSTADMIAACRAVAKAYHIELKPDYVSSLLTQIEPTDGIMYDGIVSYNHRKGQLLEYLGQLPPMRIMGIDRGGKVDTISYNKRAIRYTSSEEKEYRTWMALLKDALRRGDSRTIGHVATLSAQLHQQHLSHPYFSELMALNEEIGGLGLVIAHSGTVAGILLTPVSESFEEQVHYLKKKMELWNRTMYSFNVRRSVEREIAYDTAVSYRSHLPLSHLAGRIDYA